ncbi:MAG: ABC transporter permease [Meiothermus sp.]|nr:ABC transporter permease [Meiothermus sp.]
MFAFIVRRLMLLPLVLLALTVVIVGLLQFLTPQERAAAYITNENQARNIDKIIRERGLDQPFHVQYWKWLSSALRGDLGFSKASNKPVWDTIKERFPQTLEIALFAIIPLLGFGIWLGTRAGLNKDGPIDQFARVFAVITFNIPTFVLGILLLVVFYGFLSLAPGPGLVSAQTQVDMLINPVPRITGMLSIDSLLAGRWNVFWDVASHLVLPVITLATVSTATIIKVTRASIIEVMSQDYVRTARAKGLPDHVVNLKHARRNALIPVATLGGFTVIGLLQGAIITETIFGLGGIGSWGVDAAGKFDVPGLLGFALMAGVITVVASLLVDILYALIDPRVRFD